MTDEVLEPPSSAGSVTPGPKVDAAGYARSSYAVMPDVAEGIPGLLEALKLRSMAQLLTMLVRNRDEAISALSVLADRHNTALDSLEADKAVRKRLNETLKSLDKEAVRQLLAQAEAAKKVGASD